MYHQLGKPWSTDTASPSAAARVETHERNGGRPSDSADANWSTCSGFTNNGATNGYAGPAKCAADREEASFGTGSKAVFLPIDAKGSCHGITPAIMAVLCANLLFPSIIFKIKEKEKIVG